MLHHYLKEGLSKTAIAKKLGINRRTIHRYLKSGKTEPRYGPRPPKPCLIDPFRNYIRERLALYPELSAQRIWQEIIPLGYQGKYSTIRIYVGSQRPGLPIPIEQRYEVDSGQQAQADFATFKTPFGTVYAFLVVLSWSRFLWVHFYCHQDQLTLFNGLQQSFLAFRGVPATVLFDRMKAAVARTESDGQAIFNEEMLRFAQHYGFQPRACQPYRAKTKGRVERAVSYLRHSFFYGRNFRDLEDLNQQAEKWLAETANTRLHGTTNETPAERLKKEIEHLKPLSQEIFIPLVILGRRMSRDGYICYNGNEYSVPEGLGRAEIEVRASLEQVSLYQEGRLLVTHPAMAGRGERCLSPEHRRNLKPYLKYYEELDSQPNDFIQVERRPLTVYEEVLR